MVLDCETLGSHDRPKTQSNAASAEKWTWDPMFHLRFDRALAAAREGRPAPVNAAAHAPGALANSLHRSVSPRDRYSYYYGRN